MKHRAEAFTLAELLVVVSIIAILVSMLVPSISAGYSLAQEKTCNANLYTISKSIVAYCGNNKDQLPKNDDTNYSNAGIPKTDLLPGANSNKRWWCNKIYALGIRTPSLYRCASDTLYFNPSNEVACSYGFNDTLTDATADGGDGVVTIMQIGEPGMTFLVGHCSKSSLGKAKPEPAILEDMVSDSSKWIVGHAASYDKEAKERLGRGGFIMASGDIKTLTYGQVKLLKNAANKARFFHKD